MGRSYTLPARAVSFFDPRPLDRLPTNSLPSTFMGKFQMTVRFAIVRLGGIEASLNLKL